MTESETIDMDRAKAIIKKKHKRYLSFKKIGNLTRIAAIFIVILGCLYFIEQQLTSGRVISKESLKHEITLELDDGNIQLIKSDGQKVNRQQKR